MSDFKACCGTCQLCLVDELGDHICVNYESDNCASYVDKNDFCYSWEKKEDEYRGIS